MVDAVLGDRGHTLPACVSLEGEYGESDLCFGVPVVVGAGGMKRIVELKLSDAERAMLKKSAGEVRKGIDEVKTILG
jgi:malate dehydrogenase